MVAFALYLHPSVRRGPHCFASNKSIRVQGVTQNNYSVNEWGIHCLATTRSIGVQGLAQNNCSVSEWEPARAYASLASFQHQEIKYEGSALPSSHGSGQLYQSPMLSRGAHTQDHLSIKEEDAGFSLNLIKTLCAEGELSRAIDVLFCTHAVPPCEVYLILLAACSGKKSGSQAKRVHQHLSQHRLEHTSLFGNPLVVTFVNCGCLKEAWQVFLKLPHQTVVTWKAIISGYSQCGLAHEALRMFAYMQAERVEPDEHIFMILFKACASVFAIEEGQKLFIDVCCKGYDGNIFIRGTLLSMYGSCGRILEAENVFSKSCVRDLVLWNLMISLHYEHEEIEKALELFSAMLYEGVNPNERTYVIVLQACAVLAEREEALIVGGQLVRVKSLHTGHFLHADVLMHGCSLQIFVGSTLVSVYGKCGSLSEAEKVFNSLSVRDTVSWNVMLSAYVEQYQGEKALQLYRQMQAESVDAEPHTFIPAFQACGMLAEEEESWGEDACFRIGQALHADSRKKGFSSHIFVGASIISMYGKCASLLEAEIVFNELCHSDVVAWSAILWAYAEEGLGREALQLYRQMQQEGVGPDQQAFVTALRACCILAERNFVTNECGQSTKEIALEIGKALHIDARRRGFDSSAFVGSTLVNMYAKCGSIIEAETVFNKLSKPNVVSRNSMLAMYAEVGDYENALLLYRQIQKDCVPLDEITLLCMLQASIATGSVDICLQLHCAIVAAGYHLDSLLASTLIHAYWSCASMVDGEAVFDTLYHPDVVTWNGSLSGHARIGDCLTSTHMFGEMQAAGTKPDEITFLSLLSACGYVGLVEKGVEVFESISFDYDLPTESKHYACIVDLLGRAGDFTNTENLLWSIPMQADVDICIVLLGACRTHGNLDLGKQTFDYAMHLQPQRSGAYILMSEMYADSRPLECTVEIDDTFTSFN